MHCTIKELDRGSFSDRGEQWYFRSVQDSDSDIILSYLQANREHYNDGDPIDHNDMDQRFIDGFYDKSLVIYDARGTINSIVVYYDHGTTPRPDGEYVHGSILFIEGERNSVATKFLVNYWYHLNIPTLMYDTATDFIINMYHELYNHAPLGMSKFAIFREHLDPNNIIKITEI